MMPVIVFRFAEMSDNERSDMEKEFQQLIENIVEAMKEAENRTTNSLRQSVLTNVRKNIKDYIRLERIDDQTYHIHLETEYLKAFDVKLPIEGELTTADKLAKVIEQKFAWDIPREVSRL